MDVLAVELIIDDQKGTVRIDNFGQKITLLNKNINQLGGQSVFAGKFTTDLDAVSKRADALYKSFQDVGRVRLDAGQLGVFTKEVIRAQQTSRQLAADIINIRKELANPNRQSSIKFLTEELHLAEQQLDKLTRKLQTVRQSPAGTNAAANRNSGLNNFGEGLVNGSGLPVGGLAIGGAVAYGVGKFSSEIVDASRKAEDANRVLKATALEAGLAYEKAAFQAQKFGERAALSESKAKETFAGLVLFSNQAGRGDQLELFTRRFADLAAARGIRSDKLGDIATQLNSLVDEGTKKLLQGNPSTFFEKYAISVGKTAAALSDAEKRAAIFDEVIRRGAVFDGEAEKRLDGLSGKLDTFSAKLENFYTKLGNGGKPFINAQLDNANNFLDYLGGKGLFADKSNSFYDERNRQILKSIELSKQLSEQDEKIRAAQKNPFGSLENLALSKLNISDNFFDPVKRQQAIDKAIETAQGVAEAYKKAFKSVLADDRASVDLLKLGQKQFGEVRNLFDDKTREEISNAFARNISAATAKGFQRALSDDKTTLAGLRKNLTGILNSRDLLSDTRESLANQFEQKIKQSVDAGNNKVKELEKTYISVLDNLSARAGTNNPFVSLFSEADKSLRALRENLRGLSPEVINAFEQMEAKANATKLFEARLDNRLNVFDLREQSSAFRNFREPQIKIENPGEFFEKFIDAGLKQIEKANGGGKRFNASFTPDGSGFLGYSQTENNPYTRFHSNIFTDAGGRKYTNGFSQSDARNDLLNAYDRVSNKDGGFGGFSVRQRTFDDLSDFEKQSYLRSLQKQDDSGLRLQDKLERQLKIIQGRNVLNGDEQSIADKRFIALTSGLNPNQLTDRLREEAAAAREREAVRSERGEQDAKAERAKQIELQQKVYEETKKLRELVEKEGLQGVIRIIDESNGKADVKSRSVKTPTPRDTQDAYNQE